MLLTDTSLSFKDIKPLQRLSDTIHHTADFFTFKNIFADIFTAKNIPNNFVVVPPDPWPGDSIRGRDMIAGIFSFLGQTIVKEDLSWKPESASPEWVAELHGFEWLRDLRAVGGERARTMAREMVSLWIDESKTHDDITWRADVLGMRIKSWISLYGFFCASADDNFREAYFKSLVEQVKELSKAIKSDLSGIAFMRALRGLAYAGIALEDGEIYLEQAFKVILEQIKEQILPDGGHISRSPEAGFQFLQCLVEMRSALISAQIEMPEELQHAIDRIAPAVKFFRYGDGGLAQFNGGQEGDPNLSEMILMHSGTRGKAMKSLPHTGYERISQGRSHLVMDTGLSMVSKYSNNAHAGLFSFEYNYGRERIIVNCGTSAVKGKWSDLLRSSSAHSSLTVDSKNSCQFDASGLLSNHPTLSHKKLEDNGIALIEGAHSGYMPRFGLNHHRCIKLKSRGEILSGEEQLSGRSNVPFTVRFHLHPNIKTSLVKNNTEILLSTKSGVSWSFKAKGANIDLEESLYISEGETRRRSLQIVLSGKTQATTTIVSWEMKQEKFKN